VSPNEPASTTAHVAVIIGRWQILQRGHNGLLRAALAAAAKVVVVIGSAWRARDPRNPFTWQERQQQFEAVLTPEQRARVSFLPMRDYFDDERWGEVVREGVARLTAHGDSVTLVGFKKDLTSSYLDNFPGWSLLEIEPEYDVSSKELREIYFELEDRAVALATIGNYVEPGVKTYLEAWSHLPAYRKVASEHQAIVAFRKKYGAPVLLTADCVVTTGGHVLLIQRGGDIGNGLWALPGGFVDPHERFYAAAVRELAAEAGLKAMPSRMKNALRGEAVFDHPLRSPRGRLVTMAFHFDLGDAHLPEVRGSAVAKEARWVPVASLPAMEERIFEDHATILDHFLRLWPRA
jgi:bifunctional NMN adenylyltransferase/nudix hydrolase